MIRITPLLIAMFLSSCSSTNKEQSFLYETINWHAKKHKRKGKIYLIGSGGSVPNKVNYFTFYYEANQLVTKNEARRMIIDLVEDMIHKVNEDPSNAIYLNDFPITCKNVDLGISFKTTDHERPDPPYICLAFVSRDEIIYEMYDQQTSRFINEESEKYENALRIVQEDLKGK